MASATNSGCSNPSRYPNKESPDALSKHSRDAELLDEPYAQAVLQMGYIRCDILQAIKCLQKRDQPITAKDVLQELMQMESEGRLGTPGASASPSMSRSCPKRPSSGTGQRRRQRGDPYGSDGEERFDSLEEDGAGGEVKGGRRGEEEWKRGGGGAEALSDIVSAVAEAKDSVAAEPPRKKPTTDADGRKEEGNAVELRRRVLALREENRLLKARHMCRKCGEQPVTLTFLPCGHFSFCQDCGQSFNTCPICRKPVLADVRTFLA